MDNVIQRTKIISNEFLEGDEMVPSYKKFNTIPHYLETYDD
jgi:hypothetical protein